MEVVYRIWRALPTVRVPAVCHGSNRCLRPWTLLSRGARQIVFLLGRVGISHRCLRRRYFSLDGRFSWLSVICFKKADFLTVQGSSFSGGRSPPGALCFGLVIPRERRISFRPIRSSGKIAQFLRWWCHLLLCFFSTPWCRVRSWFFGYFALVPKRVQLVRTFLLFFIIFCFLSLLCHEWGIYLALQGNTKEI